MSKNQDTSHFVRRSQRARVKPSNPDFCSELSSLELEPEPVSSIHHKKRTIQNKKQNSNEEAKQQRNSNIKKQNSNEEAKQQRNSNIKKQNSNEEAKQQRNSNITKQNSNEEQTDNIEKGKCDNTGHVAANGKNVTKQNHNKPTKQSYYTWQLVSQDDRDKITKNKRVKAQNKNVVKMKTTEKGNLNKNKINEELAKKTNSLIKGVLLNMISTKRLQPFGSSGNEMNMDENCAPSECINISSNNGLGTLTEQENSNIIRAHTHQNNSERLGTSSTNQCKNNNRDAVNSRLLVREEETLSSAVTFDDNEQSNCSSNTVNTAKEQTQKRKENLDLNQQSKCKRVMMEYNNNKERRGDVDQCKDKRNNEKAVVDIDQCKGKETDAGKSTEIEHPVVRDVCTNENSIAAAPVEGNLMKLDPGFMHGLLLNAVIKRRMEAMNAKRKERNIVRL